MFNQSKVTTEQMSYSAPLISSYSACHYHKAIKRQDASDINCKRFLSSSVFQW